MRRRFLAAMLVLSAGCTINLADGGDGEPGIDDDCSLDADSFNPCAENAFRALARDTDGSYSEAGGSDEVVDAIVDAINRATSPGGSFDLLFIIDKTGSMSDDIAAVQGAISEILTLIETRSAGSARVGVVSYGDQCNDSVWFTQLGLTSDLDAVRTEVNSISATGGGDVPESVFEAVEDGIYAMDWRSENRFGILIGDAGPHPVGDACRSSSLDDAVDAAKSEGVTVNLYPILVAL